MRKLGGLDVSSLCLGGNVFGWTADETTSFQILDAFVAAGFNFIDTADVYSKWVPGHHGGESESIIGKWFKRTNNRSKVVLATKLGIEMGPGQKGLSRDYILREAEASLTRLQTDYIDLYQSHTDDAETPLEETLAAYSQLVQQGKVRVIGASNYKAGRLAQALEISKARSYPAYQSLQPLYNLYDREDFEANLEKVCQQNGLGVIPYYSLAAGFLTGKYRSERDLEGKARSGTVKKYLNDRGYRILAALDEVAGQYHSTPGKIALAWLMSRPGVTAPIASATSLDQLNDLIDSTNVKLEDAAIKNLDHASAYADEATSVGR